MQNKTSENIIGPDLNEYRGQVDYSLLATRTNYCYLRASGNGSGKFRVDRKFIEYVQGLQSVGIRSGGYHYAVPSRDLATADAQCDGFINVLEQAYGQGKYGDLFPVIDIEAPVDKSISTDTLLDWVNRFRKRFESKTRRKIMLYTGSFFIELYNNFYHTTKGFLLSDMPLWIAMYPEIPSNPPYPRDQGGWTRWRMWQFTENGTISGVNPPVDLNYGPVNLDLLTQPDDVRNFSAVGSGQNIRLNWSQNSDVDLAGYNIFLNSSYVTTVGKNATTYTIELGRTPNKGEKYEVSIEAFDTDGDFSPNRAKEVVTFTRSEDVQVDNMLEGEREFYEDLGEYDDFIEYKNSQSRRGYGKKIYKDPVDLLEKRFIKNEFEEEDQYELENLRSTREMYSDFPECDDEFDDISYMERLEEETAYKNFYEEESRKPVIEIEDDDDIDLLSRHKKHHKYSKCKYEDENWNNDNHGCECQYPKKASKESCINHKKFMEYEKNKQCNKCNNYKECERNIDESTIPNYKESSEGQGIYEEKQVFNSSQNIYDSEREENTPCESSDYPYENDGLEENCESRHKECNCKNKGCKKLDKDEKCHKCNCKDHDYDNSKSQDSDYEELKQCKCKKEEEKKEEKKNTCVVQDDDLKYKKIYEGVKIEAIIKNGITPRENDDEDISYEEYAYKERYEGDRRREENRDNKKYDKCGCPSEEMDNCYGSGYHMYLDNCDYGYKKHDKHKSSCHGKKKHKKHHH